MLSPKSAGLAVKNGYTNVKVFMGGEPEWSKSDYSLESSVKQIKDGNILLIDLRSPDRFTTGHIDRAVNLPLADLKRRTEETFPEYKGALIVFTSDNAADLETAIELMRDWSFNKATFFSGGMEHWKNAGLSVVTGPKSAPAKFNYVRKLEAHEVSIDTFKKAVADQGVMIIDARSTSEFAGGSFAGAINIPSEEIEKRFGDVPKDKPVIIHCATGSRAEMAYDILKGKGYTNVKLLKANISFKGGNATITE